jgi:scyllo-inositol 2-dehydrogenase (NADP+)
VSRTPIRTAVVGFGLGGRVFHAPLIAAVSDLSLAAIVTSDPERAASAEEAYPDARVEPTVDALWDRAGDLDLVVVTTPNRFHVPIALAAVEAGLHVVVDKPLAATSIEGRRLAAAAAERGVVFTVFQNRRLDGDFLTVRRLVDEGALGRVLRFESRFERWRPELPVGAWREGGGPAEAGGLLYDLGSHLVDQAVELFGRPTRVYAERERRRPGAEVDDDAFIALRHEGDVLSHLWMSAVAGSLGARFRVLGLGGAYERHGLDPQEAQLDAGIVPSDARYGVEPPERWGTLARGDARSPVPTERGDYARFYEEVAAAIRGGGPPPVSPEDAVGLLEILEAAIASAASGEVVVLERT